MSYQPPQQYPPQPPMPVKRRRPVWQWGVALIGLLLVCGIIASLAGPPKPATPAVTGPPKVAPASATVVVVQLAPTIAVPTLAAVAPTVAPTLTNTPVVAIVLPTSTTAPAAPQTVLVITKQPGTVSAGGNASVSVKTAPGASCSITVRYASGNNSTASGLAPKTADASGSVTWMWKVGAKTGPGDGAVIITCGDTRVDATITVK